MTTLPLQIYREKWNQCNDASQTHRDKELRQRQQVRRGICLSVNCNNVNKVASRQTRRNSSFPVTTQVKWIIMQSAQSAFYISRVVNDAVPSTRKHTIKQIRNGQHRPSGSDCAHLSKFPFLAFSFCSSVRWPRVRCLSFNRKPPKLNLNNDQKRRQTYCCNKNYTSLK